MNKFILRMEKTTANAVYRALQEDKKDIQEYLRSFGTTKGFLDSLENFLSRLGKRVVGAFIPRAKTTLERGANDTKREHRDKIPNLKIDFSIATRPESVYIRVLEELHLSQRKGSISATTLERIKEAVVKGTKEGMTYGQIADQIEQLDAQVFSRNRAELIAINQIGKAYQFGEFTTMQAVRNEGYEVLKYWNTVHDNRVTPRHRQNEGDGWVPMDHEFSGTGDTIAPASDHPRCRCAMIYDVGGEVESLASKHSRESREYMQTLGDNYRPDRDFIMLGYKATKNPVYENILTINPHLTQDEAIALYEYSFTDFEQINPTLRSRKTFTQYDGMILNTKSGLEKTDMVKGWVWRGVRSDTVVKDIESLELGGIFSDRAYMSASKDRSIAESFAEKGKLLKIKSKTGRYIAPYTWKDEEEVLFPPGRSFRLLDKGEDFYTMEEI